MANDFLFSCQRRRQRSKLLTDGVYTCPAGRERETRHTIIVHHQIRQQMEVMLQSCQSVTQSRREEIMFLCKQSLYCHSRGNVAILDFSTRCPAISAAVVSQHSRCHIQVGQISTDGSVTDTH